MLSITRRQRRLPILKDEILRGFSVRLRNLGVEPFSLQLERETTRLALGSVAEESSGRVFPELGGADFFFLPDAVTFFRKLITRRAPAKRVGVPQLTLEIGAIHTSGLSADRELDQLASICDLALDSASQELSIQLDPTEHWQPRPWRPTSDAFMRVKTQVAEEADARGVRCIAGLPEILAEEEVALGVLSQQDVRRLALRVKASDPVFPIKAEEASAIAPLIDTLSAAGLVEKRTLLKCRKFNERSLLVVSPDDVNLLRGTCPYCERSLSEELATEGVASNAVCDRLLDGSRWMTLLVSSILKQHGVTDEDVLTAQPVGDEEVDLFVNLFGSFAVVELKDRVFGLTDARGSDR